MGSGGITPLFLTLASDEVICQLDVQAALPLRKVLALAVALDGVFSSYEVWKLQGWGGGGEICACLPSTQPSRAELRGGSAGHLPRTTTQNGR